MCIGAVFGVIPLVGGRGHAVMLVRQLQLPETDYHREPLGRAFQRMARLHYASEKF